MLHEESAEAVATDVGHALISSIAAVGFQPSAIGSQAGRVEDLRAGG
jgi:hypothetical protein